MTLVAVPSNAVAEIDFVPQAIINKPTSYFAAKLRIPFEAGHDDLDEYVGVTFTMNGCLFAMRRYKGHPGNMVTIYLPREVENVEEITQIVSRIIEELPVSSQDVWWQRADDPDL